jgi:hypothetical protein
MAMASHSDEKKYNQSPGQAKGDHKSPRQALK